MAIVVIVLMFLCCTAKAVDATHKHNPKFPKTEEVDLFKKVVCNSQHDRLRNEVIEKSKCGEPKDVFVELKPQASYYQVVPSAVWVKRCVGLCEYDAAGSKCVATRIRDEHVPVRIYNMKTEKESCSTYKVEVHESCGCCAISAEDCVAPRVHNPRKCSCQCPNMEERRNCLKQRNLNLKWNRYKCTCEPKRRVTWRT